MLSSSEGALAMTALDTPTHAPEPRDWPEDFTDENGNYNCLCSICGNRFIGYKRRIICKLCSHAPELASWKLVPIEATKEMLVDTSAAVRDFYSEDGPYPRVKAMWRAALAASPTPPVDAAKLLEQVAVLRRALEEIQALFVVRRNSVGLNGELGISRIYELSTAALNLTGGQQP